VGYDRLPDGTFQLNSFWSLVLNKWALWQYAHNMSGAGITGAFVMTAIGAYYLLSKKHLDQAKLYIKIGVIAGVAFSFLQLFPTGDGQGRMIAHNQPATLAGMEGLYTTQQGAPLHIMGQPDDNKKNIDNPLSVPKMLSFLTYKRWNAEVKGLDAFPKQDQPDNVPLLYFAYHIMVGLGTIFIAVMATSTFLLWRGKLYDSKWMLWILMLSAPFPYIANTAGWMTAEIGRQPWLIYGLLRTSEGYSTLVSAGNGLFTLLGFMGMYTVLSILFLFLVHRAINEGPEPGEVAVKIPIDLKEAAVAVKH